MIFFSLQKVRRSKKNSNCFEKTKTAKNVKITESYILLLFIRTDQDGL